MVASKEGAFSPRIWAEQTAKRYSNTFRFCCRSVATSQQPFWVFDIEFGAGVYSFRLKPKQQSGTVSSCAVGHWLQTIGKSFGIRLPRASYRPLPFTVFVVAVVPAGINPPDTKGNTVLLRLLDIQQLVFFGGSRKFHTLARASARRVRFHRLTVGSGKDVGKIPPAPQVHPS